VSRLIRLLQYALTLFLVHVMTRRFFLTFAFAFASFVISTITSLFVVAVCRCLCVSVLFVSSGENVDVSIGCYPLLLRLLTWTNHPVLRFFTMGNEQSTFPYEPTKFSTLTTSTAKPVKSALRRTSSVSEDAAGLGQGSTIRYLPKGLGAGHSGLLIPTRPGEVATAGYHSPEWGW
jgi:hypothetical protein